MGILLDYLESLGLRGADNITQIIITSDHGWNANASSHDAATDTIMLPLVSNNASMVANRTSDNIREQCEIAPTILDYFGIPISNYQDIIDNGCNSLIGDGIPPLVTINHPQSSYSALPISFNVTLNEQGSCNYTLNSGLNNKTMESEDNLTFTASNSSLADGSYSVRYYCLDGLDNLNDTATKSFSMSTPAASSSSSGGGGGGGGGATTTSQTYYASSANVKEKEYRKELAQSDRIIIEIEKNVDSNSNGGNSADNAGSSGTSSKKTYENHTISVDHIGNNSVNLTITSDPIKVYLTVGQSIKLNLSSPDYYELFVKLENIVNNKANLTVKTINEAISKSKSGGESAGKNAEESKGEGAEEDSGDATDRKDANQWGVIASIAIIIILIGIFVMIAKRKPAALKGAKNPAVRKRKTKSSLKR